MSWGIAVENAVNSVEHKDPKAAEAKRQRVLDYWIGNELKYRNPSGFSKVR